MRAYGVTWLVLMWPVLAMACVAQAPTSPSTTFRSQLDDDWRYWMAQYPELATQFGVPGHNDRWTDYSAAAIDARAKYLRESLTRLSTVARAQLDAADQLNYDLYKELLET